MNHLPARLCSLLIAAVLSFPSVAANTAQPEAPSPFQQAPALPMPVFPATQPGAPAAPAATKNGVEPAAQAKPNGAAVNSAEPKAATPPSPTLSDLGRSLRTYFTEDELDLLFQYMKESVIASFKGEEVNLPPDLSFKLEILLVRMQKEGGHYMDNLMQQMEKDLKHKLKEKLVPPPVKEVPYNPWYPAPQR
jgi:hypothetical protein